MTEPILEANDLTIRYRTDRGTITAVSDVSFIIQPGDYFGLVGESGCGKSTIAKSIIGGLDDNAIVSSGQLCYEGEEIQAMDEQALNERIRWKEISFIPQSSLGSLNPILRLSEQAVELASVHTDLSRSEALSRFREMFEIVGLPEDRIDDYPHEFSGGMQQRAVIALALFLRPSVLIADEPTTALDVIMQDQIFEHLNRVQSELDMSLLLITHDISLIFESCDRMAVMHGGQVVESGAVTDIYDSPRHPYSYLLQRAFPDFREPDRDLETIEGSPPELQGDVDFCSFVERCPLAVDECKAEAPPTEQLSESHEVACFRHEDVDELETADGRWVSSAGREEPSYE